MTSNPSKWVPVTPPHHIGTFMLRSCKKIMPTLQALTWSPYLNSHPFHSPHSTWRDLSKSDHVAEASWCWLAEIQATVHFVSSTQNILKLSTRASLEPT